MYDCFRVIHIIYLCIGIGWLIRNWKTLLENRWTLVTWVAIAILFSLPGAYLEYPSDPWEHFRRHFAWNQYVHIRDNPLWTRFSYFWDWTFLRGVPPKDRRIAMTLLSTFWQLFLTLQVYFLVTKLNISKRWAVFHACFFIFVFGSDFHTFRYYALASTMLAQASLWRFTALVVEQVGSNNGNNGFKRFVLKIVWFLPFGLLMALNHPQSILFCSPIVIALASYFLFVRWQTGLMSLSTRIVFLAILCFSFACGVYLISRKGFWYQAIDPPFLTRWGGFHLLKEGMRTISTLGLSGGLAILLAITLFCHFPLLSMLSLAPVFTLIWPPTVLFYSQFFQKYTVVYRILYAFPLTIVLIEGLRIIFRKLLNKNLDLSIFRRLSPRLLSQEVLSMILIAILLISINLSPKFPFYGRLVFAFYKVPKQLSFENIDILAQSLVDAGIIKKMKDHPKKRIWTDNMTSIILQSHFNTFSGGERLAPDKMNQAKFMTSPSLARELKKAGFFGVLLADPSRVESPKNSWVGPVSGHWLVDWQDIKKYLQPDFQEWIATLEKAHWKKFEFKPYYVYLEDPEIEKSH